MKIYGWYDDADQTAPAYDPPHNAACLICGAALRPDDVRTLSMMALSSDGAERSYFYRVHRTCHVPLDDAQRTAIDDVVWGAIRHNGD